VTCPSLQRGKPDAAEFHGTPSRRPLDRVRTLAARLPGRLRRDDVLGQFTRFVLVGGTSTAVYAVFFVTLNGFGYLPANIVSTVVSSVLANELHRRLTFHADERVGFWAAQIEAGTVSVFGLLATSIALAWLDSAAGDAHVYVQIALVATVTGTIGMLRFVALRWIFRPAEEWATQ
jgi:putative flippase GtrA